MQQEALIIDLASLIKKSKIEDKPLEIIKEKIRNTTCLRFMGYYHTAKYTCHRSF